MDGSNVTSGEDSDLFPTSTFRQTAPDEDYAAALEGRSDINTAIGIVMGKHDCCRETALAGLQRNASLFDVPLLELAKALISATGT
jgi:AmiR/NasT family two-component response regulator